MKRLFEKYKKIIIASMIVVLSAIGVFVFYDCYEESLLGKTLETNIVSGLITALFVGLFLYWLEADRKRAETTCLQRLALKEKALNCFEEINKLIIKIRFYNTAEGYDLKDIRVSFDQVANFFVELQEIYKELPKVVERKEIDKLACFYRGWGRYFSFERPEDLEGLRNSIKCAEGYLVALKQALINFIDTLRFEE